MPSLAFAPNPEYGPAGFMRPDAHRRMSELAARAAGAAVINPAFQEGFGWDDPKTEIMVDIIYNDHRPSDGRSPEAHEAGKNVVRSLLTGAFAGKDGDPPKATQEFFNKDPASQVAVIVSRKHERTGHIVPDATLLELFGRKDRPLHCISAMGKAPWFEDHWPAKLCGRGMHEFVRQPELSVDVSHIMIRPDAQWGGKEFNRWIYYALYNGALRAIDGWDTETTLMAGAMDKVVFKGLYDFRYRGAPHDFGWQAFTAFRPYATTILLPNNQPSNKSAVCGVRRLEWKEGLKDKRRVYYDRLFENGLEKYGVAIRGLRTRLQQPEPASVPLAA